MKTNRIHHHGGKNAPSSQAESTGVDTSKLDAQLHEITEAMTPAQMPEFADKLEEDIQIIRDSVGHPSDSLTDATVKKLLRRLSSEERRELVLDMMKQAAELDLEESQPGPRFNPN